MWKSQRISEIRKNLLKSGLEVGDQRGRRLGDLFPTRKISAAEAYEEISIVEKQGLTCRDCTGARAIAFYPPPLRVQKFPPLSLLPEYSPGESYFLFALIRSSPCFVKTSPLFNGTCTLHGGRTLLFSVVFLSAKSSSWIYFAYYQRSAFLVGFSGLKVTKKWPIHSQFYWRKTGSVFDPLHR